MLNAQSAEEAAMASDGKLIAWFDDLTRDDVPRVGGKNASLAGTIFQGLFENPFRKAVISAGKPGGIVV